MMCDRRLHESDELNDKYADAYYNRGIALDDQGEHDRASAIHQVHRTQSQQARAFVGRAMHACARRRGRRAGRLCQGR